MQRLALPVGGGHLAGLQFGRHHGPIDLLFLHATGFNALTYRTLLQPLGERHRVVALDLRGHGLTTLPAHPGRLTHWHGLARDVITGIAHLTHEPVGLIAGHSLGGTTSLLVLAAAPAFARALLMLDPAVVPPHWRRGLLLPFGPTILQRRLPIARNAGRRRAHFDSREQVLASYRGRGAFKTWQAGFLEDYVEDGFAPQADGTVVLRCSPAWERAIFAAHRHDTEAALRGLRVPAHVITAEHGSTTRGFLPVFARAAPAATIEPVPGSTHFVPMEQPQLVRDRMASMITGR